MDSIKEEDKLRPAPVAHPRPHPYETRYSQYTHVANPSPQEIPSEISHAPLPRNVYYQSELIASPYCMGTLPAGAYMPGYFHSMHDGTQNNLPMDMNDREIHLAQLNSCDYKSLQGHYERGNNVSPHCYEV